ncbi:MAG: heme exporter protein CcmB [Chitinophagales bacterium]
MFSILFFEIQHELRKRLSFLSIALYIFSVTYLLYFLMNTQGALVKLEVKFWNVMFWMIIIFSIIQNCISQFSRDSQDLYYYYYTIVRPEAFIFGKICYGILYAIVLNIIAYFTFSLWFGSPVANLGLFLVTIIVSSISFSILFTLTTAISRGLQNNGILTAVLGFPLSIPLITLVARIAREAFFTTPSDQFTINLSILLGFDLLILALALILYPYIWRE